MRVTSLGLRIDVRSGSRGAVHFLNDVEKDDSYAQYYPSVRMLARARWQLVPIRKNLYTTLIVLDPTQEDSASSLQPVMRLLQGGFPGRFAVTFASSDMSEIGTEVYEHIRSV